MKKWYSFETGDSALKTELSKMLKKSGIRYELSGVYSRVHFEILCDDGEMNAVNSWFDAYYAN